MCIRDRDKVSVIRVGSNLSSPTHIGLWCNGSTTDFGSVCLGSNPSNPTYYIFVDINSWLKFLLSVKIIGIVFIPYLLLMLKKKE